MSTLKTASKTQMVLTPAQLLVAVVEASQQLADTDLKHQSL